MLLRILIVLHFGLVTAGAAHAQAYKWTDDDGVVHYSDRPQPGAQEVDLGKYSAPQGNSLARKPLPRRASAAEEDTAGTFRYESLSVASPVAEETLWNIGSVLNVSLALSPALQSGHRVQAYFDGAPLDVGGLSFQLQEVYRGEHNLQAEVLDETGRVMIRSQPTRFYVQQTSLLRPPANTP